MEELKSKMRQKLDRGKAKHRKCKIPFSLIIERFLVALALAQAQAGQTGDRTGQDRAHESQGMGEGEGGNNPAQILECPADYRARPF
ncbi:hypothetical protein VTL71DRAFT_10661 [Oculimacula yallundae]|uniref:Uncharacterized protein n=1 Tax=Oculimacula yallundae TaxID=86028 RepID=A0ABR4CUS1_9HELO